jgi:hypothetical protein
MKKRLRPLQLKLSRRRSLLLSKRSKSPSISIWSRIRSKNSIRLRKLVKTLSRKSNRRWLRKRLLRRLIWMIWSRVHSKRRQVLLLRTLQSWLNLRRLPRLLRSLFKHLKTVHSLSVTTKVLRQTKQAN